MTKKQNINHNILPGLSYPGKIPPQAIDAEESLLAAIMSEPDIFDNISSIIKPESFYKNAHRIIYENLYSLYKENKKPDLITVTEELRKKDELENIGGINYLMNISEKVVSTKYAEQHAYIIKENFLRREYIRVGNEFLNKGFDTSLELDEITNFAENSLYELTEESIDIEPEMLSSIYAETMKHIEYISELKTELLGVPSGISDLDRITLGFQQTELILLAARPSMGKTSLSLFMAKEAANMGYKILIFSLEMSKRQLSYKLMARRFTDIEALKLGQSIDWKELEEEIGTKHSENIFIDDTPGIKAIDIRSVSRKIMKKHRIDLIIVDYLQLVTGEQKLKESGNRYFGEISKVLKYLAKEMNVPVIAVSQLSRKVEERRNPFPKLSDLRDSGELEQDADVVIFLTRYDMLDDDYQTNRDGDDMRGKAMIKVGKNRNGKTGKITITVSEDAMHWGYSDIF